MFSGVVSNMFGACSASGAVAVTAPEPCAPTPSGKQTGTKSRPLTPGAPPGSAKSRSSGSSLLSQSTNSGSSSSCCSLASTGQVDEVLPSPLAVALRSGQLSAAGVNKELVQLAIKRWGRDLDAEQELKRVAELQALLEQTRREMRSAPPYDTHMPANRYGTDARLPAFDRDRHVPTLALINPHSGAKAGLDILAITRQMPYYQSRFFHIIEVVKDQRRGGLLDVFRLELNAAKEEARAKGMRPRLISGGGDGTASFALFIVFLALKADHSRADEGLMDAGNGFIWSDEELSEYFPAIVQMPLGTANDFGHTLGWGHKYPGRRARAPWTTATAHGAAALHDLGEWLEAAMSPASRVVNFDMWGILPAPGSSACDFKVCELGGQVGANPKARVDGEWQLVMKEAKTPLPLFCCLYFSMGFCAYMTARFQNNRRELPILNKMEYARQAAGIVAESVPPQLSIGLDDVTVRCGGDAYFPPRSDAGNRGSRYREVGFLNINWQGGMANGADRAPFCGRVCATREPAKFNDGLVDMYRMKLSSPLKMPNLKYQTDKRAGPVTMTYSGGRGKGVFFQWDGEARFAFSPSGEPFTIAVRKIMQVPVVLGPNYDAKITGDPDNGAPPSFHFAGDTPADRAEVSARILRCVRGELDGELNATRDEILAAGLHCESR